jgi:hypothetical protein
MNDSGVKDVQEVIKDALAYAVWMGGITPERAEDVFKESSDGWWRESAGDEAAIADRIAQEIMDFANDMGNCPYRIVPVDRELITDWELRYMP